MPWIISAPGGSDINNLPVADSVAPSNDEVALFSAVNSGIRKATIADLIATAAAGTILDGGVSSAGKIADGVITTPKLADNILTNNVAGRAKMSSNYLTWDKLARNILSPQISVRTTRWESPATAGIHVIPGFNVTVDLPNNTSKVLLLGMVSGSGVYSGITLFRDETQMRVGSATAPITNLYAAFPDSSAWAVSSIPVVDFDSPQTAGQVTYSVRFVCATNGYAGVINGTTSQATADYVRRPISILLAIVLP